MSYQRFNKKGGRVEKSPFLAKSVQKNAKIRKDFFSSAFFESPITQKRSIFWA